MKEPRISDRVMENVEILAKLALTPGEREQAREKLEEILDYVVKLNELNTEGVEPLVHLWERENVFREDVETGEDEREKLLANAPRRKGDQFQVPKTI